MAKKQHEQGREALRQVEFFRSFTDDEMDELLNISLLKKFDIHDVIIKESRKGHFFYVILNGAAKIIKGDPQGEHTVLDILSVGDCFGEIAVLLHQPRIATVVGGVNCFVFEVEGEHLDKLNINVREKLYKQFAITLARRLHLSSLDK